MGALEVLPTGYLKGSQELGFPAALPVAFSIPGCAAALGVWGVHRRAYLHVCCCGYSVCGGGEVWVCVKREKESGSRGDVIMLICVSLCLFLSKCVYIWCDCVCRGLRVLVALWVWFLSTVNRERNLDVWLENDKCQLVRMIEAVPGQVFWSCCDVGEEKEMQVKSLSNLKIFSSWNGEDYLLVIIMMKAVKKWTIL